MHNKHASLRLSRQQQCCYLDDLRSKLDVLKSASSSVLLLAPFLLFSFPPAYVEQRTASDKACCCSPCHINVVLMSCVCLEVCRFANFLLVNSLWTLFNSVRRSMQLQTHHALHCTTSCDLDVDFLVFWGCASLCRQLVKLKLCGRRHAWMDYTLTNTCGQPRNDSSPWSRSSADEAHWGKRVW